ncbi:hypothetical protein [Moheibacter sediminis]|uniref:Uncharacterized protein n=1 Tax=Moheibacter sediminis TaxID=1434700 RepID=A0A1W1ZEM6_9FLAO|nr:hypothetical protein [Moheibacter sediminis]SMC46864.1 hypothetical protein SAMN06296427_102435 [Moheibacter sediminis]
MKYSFNKYDWDGTTVLGIEIENTIRNMGGWDWTATKAQEIIDGVKSTIDTDVEYQWANEDVFLVSHPTEGVIFWDLMKTRGQGSGVRTTQDLVLPYEEFIAFMEDFKKFIEENS